MLTRFFILLLSCALAGCGSDLKPYDADFCGDKNDAYFVGGTARPYIIKGITYYPQKCYDYHAEGEASWYGEDCHGKPTASGQTFCKRKMTAAHRTLPIPSIVRVTNLKNNRSVLVLITDRGPYVNHKPSRIIDLSKAAFQAIGHLNEGILSVRVESLRDETLQIVEDMVQKKKLKRKK
jgi:rare lipoprotein A